MKSFFLIFLLSGWVAAKTQAVGVFGGRSLMAADHLAVRYLHPSNYPLQFTAQLFRESSNRKQLHYVSYGAITSVEISSAVDSYQSSSLSYRLGLGAVILIEREPWILSTPKSHHQTGLGLAGEVTGIWNVSSAFGLCVFGQQKWLFSPVLGNRQFVFGMGLVYQLNIKY
ncbi:MAG: hypothetical protein IM584_11890 [Chitinophagaceae bacterium]|nr:hypothetical protein [Chitinophagaceae bacterium]MCA6451803.1 hypothetical protein [Chitinophagaceae bacterium]MCA6456825.1 hypothetical protein [Chitinophagaceae bacterium]MCA6460408.1 hypothetical protein [Chitinophagaceae bacterium]MCA6465295.1 hypothetical protein [Chitinophagaceae bacterium]